MSALLMKIFLFLAVSSDQMLRTGSLKRLVDPILNIAMWKVKSKQVWIKDKNRQYSFN